MSSRLLLIAAVCVLLAAAGCNGSFVLMPPPAYVSTDGYARFSDHYFQRVGASPEVNIFYATDRAPAVSDQEACEYAAARGNQLRLGTARVVIGDADWSMPELMARSFDGEKIRVRCQTVDELGSLYSTIPPTSVPGLTAYYSNNRNDPIRQGSNDFAALIDQELERTGTSDIYILVTGLSTTFHHGIEHAAALHHYLGHGGLMLAYPWPTRSTPIAVNKDRLSGRISARALRELVLFLAEETQVRRINFIGYSAGAEVLSLALYQLRLASSDWPADEIAERLKIGQVVLAAPDIDYTEFRNMLLDNLVDVAEHFTIYVNADDKVLRYSHIFSTGAARLGRAQDVVSDVEKALYRQEEHLTFIDPSNGEKVLGESDSRGHSYWFENPWVSSDVMIAVTAGLDPAERGLVRSGTEVAWGFPDDYVERTERLFRKLPQNSELGGQTAR